MGLLVPLLPHPLYPLRHGIMPPYGYLHVMLLQPCGINMKISKGFLGFMLLVQLENKEHNVCWKPIQRSPEVPSSTILACFAGTIVF